MTDDMFLLSWRTSLPSSPRSTLSLSCCRAFSAATIRSVRPPRFVGEWHFLVIVWINRDRNSQLVQVESKSVHITAVVSDYVTPTQRVGKGVCTNYLLSMNDCHLQPYRVPVFIRKSNFKLPRVHTKAIIMVGPGTGLAPFRGFIQERAWLQQQGMSKENFYLFYQKCKCSPVCTGKQVGPNVLFFGCRSKDEFIYEDELKKYQSDNHVELYTAFSRADPSKKVYVQHLLVQQSKRVYELLQDGAYFYICGYIFFFPLGFPL